MNVPPFAPGRPRGNEGMTYQEFLDWRAAQAGRSRDASPSPRRWRMSDFLTRRKGTARLSGEARRRRRPSSPSSAHVPCSDERSCRVTRATRGCRGAEFRHLATALPHSVPRVVGKTIEFCRATRAGGRPLTIMRILPDQLRVPTGAKGELDTLVSLVTSDGRKSGASILLIGRLQPRRDPGRSAVQEATRLSAPTVAPPLRARRRQG